MSVPEGSLDNETLQQDAKKLRQDERWLALLGGAGLAAGVYFTALSAGEVSHDGAEDLSAAIVVVDLVTLYMGTTGVVLSRSNGRRADIIEAEILVRERAYSPKSQEQSTNDNTS